MTPGDVAFASVVAMVVLAFCAGWVDAVVGGGGLIQLPALLVGLPKEVAFGFISGTNKVSSVAGTFMATATYLRRLRLHWPLGAALVAGAAVGATVGAHVARLMPKAVFTPVLLAVMIGLGGYLWRRPQLGLSDVLPATGPPLLLRGGAIGFAVGLWDGMVGPGTGTFFIILLVSVLGLGFLQAGAYAKLANLTTNLAAIGVFAAHGQVLWWLGLPMAAANFAGGLLGAHLALRHGNAFVRKVFLAVLVVLILKLGFDTLQLAWGWWRARG